MLAAELALSSDFFQYFLFELGAENVESIPRCDEAGQLRTPNADVHSLGVAHLRF